LRLLWLNWRDIKHPESGGAEVLTHEVMKRLVDKGHEMTLFCPKVPGRPNLEEIDGVKIIREGGKYTCYNKGKAHFKKYRDFYDFVIDEINPKPFLTPKILGSKPALVLFHQMIREEWFYEMRFPLNYLCNFYENRWLKPYKDVLTLTVSQSSKNDLEDIGFTRVRIVPMGQSTEPLKKVGPKEEYPTVLFIGRLKKHKLPDHAIRAFLIIKNEIPSAKMWVIGDGYMRSELEKMSTEDITFFGRVDIKTKFDLLSRAHLVLVPSVREG
jgi:glycosyltransferase involved in cell wall biosynthesis